ncbi:MAG: fatty acid desaturase [Gemmatimonadaceae bacterium]|nr:fatty acid desaturase [Gemmatimonadaceae bacterium]
MAEKVTLASSNGWATAIVAWQLAFTACAIALSVQDAWPLWLLGQVLLAVNLFQWFVLHHDFAHGGFFRTRWLNALLGHVSSVFCLMPFFSWRQMHHHHHIWSGWKDKDPSDPSSQFRQPTPTLTRVMNFCWRFWIPVFAATFVAMNFWNLKRVNELFPDPRSRRRNLFSVLFLMIIYVPALVLAPRFMLVHWVPALLLFLSFSDPVLLTQHVHVDANYAAGAEVKAFRYSEQGRYARNVIYPRFVAKFLFYNSERHGLHHLHPTVPIYHLGELESPKDNNIDWLEWLRLAKAMPADVLIFQTSRETGIRL